MNIPYMVEKYPFRSHLITDKDIREAAFPIHMILQTLRYVVKYHEKLDPDFVMPEDDKVAVWIENLETARNAAIDQKKGSREDWLKRLKSVDVLVYEIMGNFFEQRESIYLIYTIFIMLQNIIEKGKWFIPYRAEKYFYQVYVQLAEYMETKHSAIIEGAEKSATKQARKIVTWLNEREMYQ